MSSAGQVENVYKRMARNAGSYTATGMSVSQADLHLVAQAKALLINSQLQAFILYCYEKDEKGNYKHLSGNTQIDGRSRCPWGSVDKRMELTKKDRWIMRHWLLSFSNERPKPLFFYMANARRWYVNTVSWDTLSLALSWGEKHVLTAEEYMAWEAQWVNR